MAQWLNGSIAQLNERNEQKIAGLLFFWQLIPDFYIFFHRAFEASLKSISLTINCLTQRQLSLLCPMVPDFARASSGETRLLISELFPAFSNTRNWFGYVLTCFLRKRDASIIGDAARRCDQLQLFCEVGFVLFIEILGFVMQISVAK